VSFPHLLLKERQGATRIVPEIPSQPLFREDMVPPDFGHAVGSLLEDLRKSLVAEHQRMASQRERALEDTITSLQRDNLELQAKLYSAQAASAGLANVFDSLLGLKRRQIDTGVRGKDMDVAAACTEPPKCSGRSPCAPAAIPFSASDEAVSATSAPSLTGLPSPCAAEAKTGCGDKQEVVVLSGPLCSDEPDVLPAARLLSADAVCGQAVGAKEVDVSSFLAVDSGVRDEPVAPPTVLPTITGTAKRAVLAIGTTEVTAAVQPCSLLASLGTSTACPAKKSVEKPFLPQRVHIPDVPRPSVVTELHKARAAYVRRTIGVNDA